jgi:hypothetical protein
MVNGNGSSGGSMKEPAAIAMAPDGSIWVADTGNNRIEQWSTTLSLTRFFGSEGSGNGQFKRPAALDVDSAGTVWVGDQNNQRIQQFTSTGEYVAQLGGPSDFAFSAPMGVAADNKGGLWVTDTDHNRLQRILTSEFETPVATQVPAIDYSYSGTALTKMELEEPEVPDPSISVATTSGLATSATSGADTATYSYASGNLTSEKDSEGETKFERDAGNRITKIMLPNGTWASITYDSLGRATKVVVKPAGETEKTTNFKYEAEPRKTYVWGTANPEVIYYIGEDGSVFKWENAATPPTIASINGSLWGHRNDPNPVENKDQTLVVTAESQNEIASIKVIVDGNAVVEEKTCEDKSEPPAHNCDRPEPLEWIPNPSEFAPGRLDLEIVATDFQNRSTAERFFVTMPQQPPPNPEEVEHPDFASIKLFREDHGLDREKPMTGSEMTRFILELLYEWEAQLPTPMAAVHSWGIPMRGAELNEMEWRREYINQAAEFIPEWAEEHAPASYGGFYVDEREGGKIYVGFTETQQALVASLKESGGLINPGKVYEFPTPPTRSLGSMEELEQAAVNVLATSSSAGQATTGVELSDDSRDVRVGATNPSLVEQTLNSQFGPSAPIQVFADTPTVPMASRYTSGGPVVAGAALRIGNKRCTAGFGAKAPNEVINGQMTYFYFALTAGHCATLGTAVSREALREALPGPIIGTVRRYGLLPYGTLDQVSTDGEGVRLTDKSFRSHGVLNGSPLEVEPIQGIQSPKVGRKVCWSGIKGGRHCGKIIKRVSRVVEGRFMKLFKVEGPDAQGDSGAPVWDPVTHKAIGLITSGEKSSDKPCHILPGPAEWCPRMLFTPLLPRPNRKSDPPGIAPTLGIEILTEN